MKQRWIKTALALWLMGMGAAGAAQPFSDVDTNSWAYGAVKTLAEKGVIEGYPDDTFRGNRAVTRYELSQMVARLLAKEESLTAEEKATVKRLSEEYKDELKSLGVRLDAVEKKIGKTQLITEFRVHGINRYDNVYRGSISKHYETGVRVRANTITTVNPRVRVYGQLETYMSMNGTPLYDVNATYNAPHNKDSELHLGHLFTTYQFGKVTPSASLMGATKNLIGIGQFPVKMGVTGYTYDGAFKGAFVQFGDAAKGSHLRLAVGRATHLNYDYTSPMMRGMEISKDEAVSFVKKAVFGSAYKQALAGGRDEATAKKGAMEMANAMAKDISDNFKSTDPMKQKEAYETINGLLTMDPTSPFSKMAKNFVPTPNGNTAFTYYPMGDNVRMKKGEDEDVPAIYASYIYKNPQKYEFHAYALKATGPVGHICSAYGLAASYHVTPKLELHGEYVRNMRRLPLNNEKPMGYNYGLTFGNAHILKAGSYALTLDYVYSQAGSYFGGSTSDIADQYMGHIYTDWRGRGAAYGPMPAYFADKMDNLLSGQKMKKVGGAKFYLAKVQYVPMMGLMLEGSYGFNASDMGHRKMDNILMVKATAFIK